FLSRSFGFYKVWLLLCLQASLNAVKNLTMSLPLPLEILESPEIEPLRPLRKPTLLIVDDEEGPRQSLRVVFKDEYQLLLAGDGPTAIQLAQEHKIDVAVLDIRMAGMSGIELLERLKF